MQCAQGVAKPAVAAAFSVRFRATEASYEPAPRTRGGKEGVAKRAARYSAHRQSAFVTFLTSLAFLVSLAFVTPIVFLVTPIVFLVFLVFLAFVSFFTFFVFVASIAPLVSIALLASFVATPVSRP